MEKYKQREKKIMLAIIFLLTGDYQIKLTNCEFCDELVPNVEKKFKLYLTSIARKFKILFKALCVARVITFCYASCSDGILCSC